MKKKLTKKEWKKIKKRLAVLEEKISILKDSVNTGKKVVF